MSDPYLDRFLQRLCDYREDARLFVREVIGVTPTPQQDEILLAISKPGARVSVSSGHGTGKSTLEAWLVLWFVSLFQNCRAPCTAPTKHQLEDVLWGEIAKWHQRMHQWFRQQLVVTSDRVFVANAERTRFAVGRTARRESPEALQGFHADNMLFLIDEASGVPEAVFEVAQGALSTPKARVLMAANPTQTSGYFFQSHHRMKHVWQCFRLSSADSPLVSKEYVEDMKSQYGDDSDIYRVRVLGEFPRASIAQLIPRELCEESCHRRLAFHQYNFAPVVLGVDVAWEGDDRSCVFLRQGVHSKVLGVWRNIDNMTLGGLVNQYWGEHKADAVFIDTGWGSGVIDYLRSLGRAPIAVNFGGKSISEEYVNKRSEMWCELRNWLAEGGVIPDNSDLIEDLVGPNYFFAPNGKKGLERKQDMKRRGLPSPDLADALALTFAAPVHKDLPYEQRRLNDYDRQRHFCRSDYDPLA